MLEVVVMIIIANKLGVKIKENYLVSHGGKL
jgi:hypothetical protein